MIGQFADTMQPDTTTPDTAKPRAPSEAAPPGRAISRWRRAAGWLQTEHFLLVLFLVWAAQRVDDWKDKLDGGINPNKINDVGFWWVAGPGLVMLGIIILQALARIATTHESRGRAALGGLTRVLRWAADWVPFALFLSFYLMFRSALMRTDVRDHDLVAAEEWIFGGHLSIWLERFVTPTTVLVAQIFYWGHIYLTTPAIAVATYLKDRRLFRALMLGMTVVAIVGALGYYYLPGAGPGRYLRDQYHADLPVTSIGAVLDLTFNALRSPDDVFPSLHVALSLLCLIEARRTWRWFFWAMFPWVMGNWVSTVFLRYHYVIDLFAGAALAVFAHYACHALVRAEERLRNLVVGDTPHDEV